MQKDKNVLYLIDENNSLHIESETFVIKDNEQNKVFQIPIIKIDCIIIHGYIEITNKVIYKCADNGIELVLLNHYGDFKARIVGKIVGNVELRQKQFLLSNNINDSLKLAKMIVKGKINNQIAVMERGIRSYSYDLNTQGILYKNIRALELYLINIEMSQNVESVRGIEGKASALYFSIFDYLIIKQKDKFRFEKRSRRPPLNEVNSMLSYLYVILASEVNSALYTVGLDPYVGVIHADKSGRASLALDIMEELRMFMVDRLVLSLINKNQVHLDSFEYRKDNGVFLNDKGKKIVLEEWEKRKRNTVIHPYLKENITYGLIPYYQAVILARYIRGDIDEYITYKWR